MTTDVHVAQRWIEIPSVVGMTVREASDRLAAAGFTPAASPRRFTEDKGDIVGGTVPPEGTVQQRRARVDLIPARPEPVQASADEGLTPEQLIGLGIMPDLTEFTAEEAIAFVTGSGFGAWAREAYTDKVDPGFVVATYPPAGSAANITPITIYYAVPVPPVLDPVVDESGALLDQTPVIPVGTPTPLKG